MIFLQFKRLLGYWQKVKRRLDPPYFHTSDVSIGKGVRFGRNVEFNCKKVRIGDGCIFMDDIVVNADEFYMGDFGTVYSNCFFPGPGKLVIGHNSWFGNGVIIDAQGGTTIGNNVGIASYSQLWSHIKFGDIAYGSRFNESKPLMVEDDVWILPGCIVASVTMGTKSMLLGGSVLSQNTAPNTIFAGVPARSMSGKMELPFRQTEVQESQLILNARIAEFCKKYRLPEHLIQVIDGPQEQSPRTKVLINAANRTYIKKGSRLERLLMRYLLPDVKLLPSNE